MTHRDILAWGKRHHFPFLVLGEGDYIQHGEAYYQALRRHRRRLRLASQRIERWNAIEATCEDQRQESVA